MANIDEHPRLGFFWDMIQMRDENRNTISKVLNYTQPAVQRWWRVDDIRLSIILDAAEKLNVRIEFALIKKGLKDESEKQPPYISDMIRKVNGKYRARNLEFIEMALRCNDIHKTDWAKAINTGHVTVYQWFTKDDIMWSRVCQFAQLFGFDIHIRISTPPPVTDEKKSRIMVTIANTYGCEIPAQMPKKD